MTVNQLKAYLAKHDKKADTRYIRLEDDTFEFETWDSKKKHADMANGRTLISAGFLIIRPTVINVTGTKFTT